MVGIAILTFLALPQLDTAHALALTNCLAIVPGLLNLMTRRSGLKDGNNKIIAGLAISALIVIDVIAILAQLSGILVWPLLQWIDSDYGTEAHVQYPWAIPLGLMMASFGWWECYVDNVTRKSKNPVLKFMHMVRKNMIDSNRYHFYVIISVLKMAGFLLAAWLITHLNGLLVEPLNLFSKFSESFGVHYYKVKEITDIVIGDKNAENPGNEGQYIATLETLDKTPLWVLIIQMGSTYLTYIFSKFACKVEIQGFSFALPISIIVPTCMTLVLAGCGAQVANECTFYGIIPRYLFFDCPSVGDFLSYLWQEQMWLWALWFLSQLWITIHIWFPRSGRLASTEQLFGSPMYSGLFVDQSVVLNRRRDGTKVNKSNVTSRGEQKFDKDRITRIYGCATMWHETKSEMVEILKSLFRIDSDYSNRRLSRKYLKAFDEDYYKWETHILFDDAFKVQKENKEDMIEGGWVINDYVQTLIRVIDEAGSYVLGKNIRVASPKKIPTPYGGRLIWKLPGGTKIVCHLKDKAKIRHKKRWSQCMYMYYLLGYKLMDDTTITDEQKETRAENTYLLALDGDIDFQPEAVLKLVDLMKKNKNLGAACGRIHPLGSGFMKWYQVFEYAIGHWLQKSTEHIMGCVLCSPGCFSLFRAKALMDYNVMRMYTTVSEKPLDYVQYDQGEDRWLCTLLLQRGWRVAYAAASDAYTFVPESFNEFFNQRRRWMPSTIANIVDLLSDSKRLVKENKDISTFYVIYQIMLMVGTILGPGTIFLMLVGAFTAAFQIPQLDFICLQFDTNCGVHDNLFHIEQGHSIVYSSSFKLYLCFGNDGSIGWNCIASFRGWTIGTFFFVIVFGRIIIYSGCYLTSSRILLFTLWCHLLCYNPCHVSPTCHFFHF